MAKKQWELWYANFPFEDKNISKDRPVIILSVQPLCVLSIKVTSHEVREADKYDVPITHWQEAGLKHESPKPYRWITVSSEEKLVNYIKMILILFLKIMFSFCLSQIRLKWKTARVTTSY